MTEKEEALLNYLIDVTSNFNSTHVNEIITGMSATEILDIMDRAITIKNKLESTALGKELT